MTTYTYVATNTVTGQTVAQLPLVANSFSDVMNGSGQLNATAYLGDPNVSPDTILGATNPVTNALWVYRDSTLVWGGPIVGRSYSRPTSGGMGATTHGDDYQLTIVANDWWWYLTRRIVKDHNFVNVDQCEIARQLIANDALIGFADVSGATWYPPANIYMNTTIPTSGQLLTVSYQQAQQRSVADVVQELANQAPPYGFEFGVHLGDPPPGLPLGAAYNLWYPSHDYRGS